MDWLIDYISDWHPIEQALLATLFTWGVTAVGASLVFFFKTFNQKLLDNMMGFAAGAMIFVVIEELIPESQLAGDTDTATTSTLVRFGLMMLLDVALG